MSRVFLTIALILVSTWLVLLTHLVKLVGLEPTILSH